MKALVNGGDWKMALKLFEAFFERSHQLIKFVVDLNMYILYITYVYILYILYMSYKMLRLLVA